MQIDQVFKQYVREAVAECLSESGTSEPELITTKEAAEFCGCGEDTIRDLFNEREVNGFPGIVLGAKTHRVDKVRLRAWLNNGGLSSGNVLGDAINSLNRTIPPMKASDVVQIRRAG